MKPFSGDWIGRVSFVPLFLFWNRKHNRLQGIGGPKTGFLVCVREKTWHEGWSLHAWLRGSRGWTYFWDMSEFWTEILGIRDDHPRFVATRWQPTPANSILSYGVGPKLNPVNQEGKSSSLVYWFGPLKFPVTKCLASTQIIFKVKKKVNKWFLGSWVLATDLNPTDLGVEQSASQVHRWNRWLRDCSQGVPRCTCCLFIATVTCRDATGEGFWARENLQKTAGKGHKENG